MTPLSLLQMAQREGTSTPFHKADCPLTGAGPVKRIRVKPKG